MQLRLYSKMLCAVYSSPQETSKHSILWSDDGNPNLEKKEQLKIWQLRKVERKQRKKLVEPRRAEPKRAEPKRRPRRDSSNHQGTQPFTGAHTSPKVYETFQKERRILQVKFVVPLVFVFDFLRVHVVRRKCYRSITD